jgi:hypothetical protein
MSRDFTFTKYKELCQAIHDSGYPVLNIESYLNLEKKPDSFIILRHDVDLLPERSVVISQIEADFKLHSTYYFRTTEDVFKHELIKQIAELGHEIGYHYEVLDKTKGDIKNGIELFDKELKDFRKICDIKTICMHGNSRTKWDNRDLWKYYDFKNYDLLGDAYLSINFDSLMYFSDTARTWDPKYKIKDMDPKQLNNFNNNKQKTHDVRKTEDLINIIKSKEISYLYILVHPDDWCDNFGKWVYNIIIRQFKNIGKTCIRYYRNNVLNKE